MTGFCENSLRASQHHKPVGSQMAGRFETFDFTYEQLALAFGSGR
jgi:hypothetical protein